MKPATPERWAVAAGDAVEAVLTIPADAQRVRRFEIACAMRVALAAPQAGAWHALTVWVDGTQQWQRRVPTQSPGDFDGLDLRFSRSVPVGCELRVVARVDCAGGRRRSLDIEADELG